MVQEEQKIISLLSEPLKIEGFDLIEVKVDMLNAQKKIQLYIEKLKLQLKNASTT